MKDKDSKELFDYIRSVDTSNMPSLKEILGSANVEKVIIEDLLSSLQKNEREILLIDARSEKEYEESSIPYSVNFPVLNNSERHNTGLIYKKYSRSAALYLAMEYAGPKTDALNKFLKKNNASQKDIFIYCWRGGGRSGYLAKMVHDLGYNPVTLIGGQRAFRKHVNDFFIQKTFPFELMELSGLTGSGKTELLKAVSDSLPVIDLEDAAKHYSSLLGQIPYEINNIPAVKNQSAFENNLFSQVYFNEFGKVSRLSELSRLSGLSKKELATQHTLHTLHTPHTQHTPYTPHTQHTFLIESESKKVGNFEIPKLIYDKMQSSPTVRIISSMESRVSRIVRDYFGEDLRGIELMLKIMKVKEKFFRQQLSNKIYEELILLLNQKRVEEFTEIMIIEYYDKKYKDKGKKQVAEISSDDTGSAVKELIKVFQILQ